MKNRQVRKFLAISLAAAMATGSMSTTAFAASGYLDPNASIEREKANAEISQYAATQGMVLMENKDQALPISQEKGTKVALYGNGVYNTIKGGTGSGNVNVREEGNILVKQGFEDAGYDIVNNHKYDGEETSFLEDRIAEYNQELKKYEGKLNFNYVHNEPVYEDTEKGLADVEAAAKETDTAIYVLARTSGEGKDRAIDKGDYYLSDAEKANLTLLGQKFEHVIVVLNVGGIVDTNFFNGLGGYTKGDEYNRDKIEGLDALFLMSQAGMNEGHALVQVLNGTYNPSGKLTDTWAIDYKDYPASATISNNDGNSLEEFYQDDIFVGYRYFDTFGKKVAYEFGYGLSYTDFEIHTDSVEADENQIKVSATVTNTGTADGKEVVEVYFSAPDGELDKPYQELAGYKKVEVEAGKSQKVEITFDTDDMASYDAKKEAYVMEPGDYTIRVGNSSRNNAEAAKISLDTEVVTEYCDNELGLTKESMEAGSYDAKYVMEDTATAVDLLDSASEGFGTKVDITADGVSADHTDLSLKSQDFPNAETHTYGNGEITAYVSANDEKSDSYAYAQSEDKKEGEKLEKVTTSDSYTLVDVVNGKISAGQLVASMSNTELADLVEGGTYTGVQASGDNAPIIGNNADSVFGAAGETTSNLYNSRFIPNIVLSDGPAGIRISNKYLNCLPVEEGAAYISGITYYKFHAYQNSSNPAYYYDAEIKSEADYNAAIAAGEELFTEEGYRYQYCTAFPVGTCLAQTWDPEVIEMVGRAIGTEMLELGITSLLAPGMNIHRDPICGRNYEYYSEDPLVSGLTAAAVTDGVQKNEDGSATGIGVTIKHFAFNNQEASRFGSNSVVSERAAREIYLKGFEITVKKSAPMFIMSSYNQVNGASTFQHYGLLTEILRNEWGFDGFVMSDWYSVFGVKQGSMYYGRNIRAVMMRAGNDCEMPGKNEAQVLKGLEDGEMRLGDLQKSAINMLNVIKRTKVFDTMNSKLINSDAAKAAEAAQKAQKEAEAAKAAAEAARKEAEAARKEAEKKAAEAAEKAKAAEEAKKEAEEKAKAAENEKNAAAEKAKASEEAQKEAEEKAAAAEASQKAAEAAKVAAEKAAAEATKAAKEAQEAKAAFEKAQQNQKTILTVTKKKVSVKAGKKVKIKASASTADKITFKSMNKKIATVSKKGVVKGKKKGKTSIRVTCNGVTKKVKVTVK